jgi:PST family polysaccharide transporter/lipopolysaccharide exporter
MSADRQRLAQGFLNVFALVLLFALPAAAGIALLAEPMVAVLLGPKWSDAAPMVQVLAIYGGIRAAQANTGSVYLALDRPQYASAITLLGIVLGFGSFAVALWHSVPVAEAAWFLVGGSFIVVVINLTLLTRLLGLNWSDIFRALLRPAIGITVMAAALALLRVPLWNGGHPLAAGALILVGLVLAGAIVYLASVMLAWRAHGRPVESPEYALLATVAGSVRRRNAA